MKTTKRIRLFFFLTALALLALGGTRLSYAAAFTTNILAPQLQAIAAKEHSAHLYISSEKKRGTVFEHIDVDQDNDLDLVLLDKDSFEPISVWLNDAHGSFEKTELWWYTQCGYYNPDASKAQIQTGSLQATSSKSESAQNEKNFALAQAQFRIKKPIPRQSKVPLADFSLPQLLSISLKARSPPSI